METTDFELMYASLKDEVTSLAQTSFSNYKKEAKEDALKSLNDLKDNLSRWFIQLHNKEITEADFKFLLSASKELMGMHALKTVGITLVEIDKFKKSLLNIITKVVLSKIPLVP